MRRGVGGGRANLGAKMSGCLFHNRYQLMERSRIDKMYKERSYKGWFDPVV